MSSKLHDAFDAIKADEKLKETTLNAIEACAAQGSMTHNKPQQQRNRRSTPLRLGFAAAAVVLAFFVGVFSYSSYFTKAFFLDIDVNPSIELTINSFDRVIGAYAYNEEGKEVLAASSVENMTSEEALTSLIDTMIEMGYVDNAELLSATLQEENEQDANVRLATLQTLIASLLQERGYTLEQEVFLVDAEVKGHAHGQNMTPAKYLAIVELMEEDPTVSFESCRHHSISSIKQQTQQHRHGSSISSEQGAAHGAHGNAASATSTDTTHNAYGNDTSNSHSGSNSDTSGHNSDTTEGQHHDSSSSHNQGISHSGSKH